MDLEWLRIDGKDCGMAARLINFLSIPVFPRSLAMSLSLSWGDCGVKQSGAGREAIDNPEIKNRCSLGAQSIAVISDGG